MDKDAILVRGKIYIMYTLDGEPLACMCMRDRGGGGGYD